MDAAQPNIRRMVDDLLAHNRMVFVQTIMWLRRGMKHCVRTREWRLNMSPSEHQKLVQLSKVTPPTVRSFRAHALYLVTAGGHLLSPRTVDNDADCQLTCEYSRLLLERHGFAECQKGSMSFKTVQHDGSHMLFWLGMKKGTPQQPVFTDLFA